MRITSNRININIVLLFAILAFSVPLKSQVVDGIAAVVGNEIILKSEVDQFAQSQAIRLRIDPNRSPSRFESLWRNTLKTMIDQKILLDRADIDSIEVSEREVEETLDFQIDGILQRVGSKEKVEEILGYSLNKLKRSYREEIRKQKLVEKIQQRKFSDLTAGRREVEEYFIEHSDSLPELKPAVRIGHILLEVNPGTGANESAFNKADSILTLINNGGDFSELAQKYSEDTNSALKGGELGFMRRGSLVPEFEEVSYLLSPDEVSDIVKTEFGYHIIKMIERRGELINVKHILIMLKISNSDEKLIVDKLNMLKERIIAGEDFESLALEYSDDPEISSNKGSLGWFELNSLTIPQFFAVLDTLPVGDISDPFKTDFGYHIVTIFEKREGGALSLENNWHDIEAIVIQNKRLKVYNEWLNSLRDEVFIDIKM